MPLAEFIVEPGATADLVTKDVGHGLTTLERHACEKAVDAFGEF
jgi:hypothetical protein